MVNGEPREVDFEHPSELAGLTLLPVTITKTVLDNLPAVTSLIYKPQPGSAAATKADAKKTEAETENVKAKKELIQEANKAGTGGGYQISVPLDAKPAPPSKPTPPKGPTGKPGGSEVKEGDPNFKGFGEKPELPKLEPSDKGPESEIVPPVQ